MIFESLKLAGKVVLAPMAGVTDSAFRTICRQMGAAMVFSEMISADGLYQKNQRTRDYLFFLDEERPFGFQLFGSEADIMAKAIEVIVPFKPDFIDLNFGCPVKKVVKSGAGAALLKDIPRLTKITTKVVANCPIPVFAKIRSGWEEQDKVALEVATILEQCGVQAITIHPRSRAQQFKGLSDWHIIAKIKQQVSIPVIGSGDVKSAEETKKMIDQTGCDLVMIGRACLGNPWIFRQANYFLKTGKLLPKPDLQEKLKIIFKHFDSKIKISGTQKAVFEMRKHIAWYVRGLSDSAKLKANLFKLTDVEDIKNMLSDYFLQIERV